MTITTEDELDLRVLSQMFAVQDAAIEISTEKLSAYRIEKEDEHYFVFADSEMVEAVVWYEDDEEIIDFAPGNGYRDKDKAERLLRRLKAGEVTAR